MFMNSSYRFNWCASVNILISGSYNLLASYLVALLVLLEHVLVGFNQFLCVSSQPHALGQILITLEVMYPACCYAFVIGFRLVTFSQLFRLPIYCYGIGQKKVCCWTYSFSQIQQGLAKLLFLAFPNNLFLFFQSTFSFSDGGLWQPLAMINYLPRWNCAFAFIEQFSFWYTSHGDSVPQIHPPPPLF